jgi:hypothetical protein
MTKFIESLTLLNLHKSKDIKLIRRDVRSNSETSITDRETITSVSSRERRKSAYLMKMRRKGDLSLRTAAQLARLEPMLAMKMVIESPSSSTMTMISTKKNVLSLSKREKSSAMLISKKTMKMMNLYHIKSTKR